MPPDAHLDHFWDAIEIAVAGAIYGAISETLSSFEKVDKFGIPVPPGVTARIIRIRRQDLLGSVVGDRPTQS